MTQSIWALLIGVTCFYWLFQTENGHEFMYIGEGRMVNKVRKPNYIQPVLIEPQSTRRQLISRQNITQASYHGEDLEWQDMNLVLLGGDTLIDLRDLQLPLGDSVIMVRKVYGRTRIILSQDIGLSINFSTIKGSITIGQEVYDLLGENLRYQEPDYSKRNRRVKLIISQAMGDLEVIIL
ncbi:cell wall-active antibiotics response protein LiaF [Hutsoniella sourekii]